MDKITLDRPVIAEGKYDKIKLESVLDTEIIVTNGFGIFRSEEKKKYIARLAGERGVIVLTDSDGAGMMIRNCLKGFIPEDRITNLYIPQIIGREKRKNRDSAEGFLGVEGMDTETLRRIFEPLRAEKRSGGVTSVALYNLGLLGKEGSAEKRGRLCMKLGLPGNLSSKEFASAVNLISSPEELERMINEDQTVD